MKTIIHDLDENLGVNDSFVVNNADIKSCIGCFNCWIKTPKVCIHKDKIQNISSILLKSDEFIIISKCINGCYSYKVKQILERCIGFVEPFFEIRNKEIHHKSRHNINLSVYFYGNIDEKDKIIATNLVKANAKNLNSHIQTLKFYKDIKSIKEEIL